MGEPPRKDFPPGWNDPPVLNYNSANPPPKSRITNKRVAFPLGPSSGNPSAFEPVKITDLPIETDSECVESLYLKASENFNKLLENVSDEGIREQIWQMLHAWQARKLPVIIQNMLTDLSNNIVEHNTAKINEIHLQLTMDNSSHITTYLPALKHLINCWK